MEEFNVAKINPRVFGIMVLISLIRMPKINQDKAQEAPDKVEEIGISL